MKWLALLSLCIFCGAYAMNISDKKLLKLDYLIQRYDRGVKNVTAVGDYEKHSASLQKHFVQEVMSNEARTGAYSPEDYARLEEINCKFKKQKTERDAQQAKQ